MHHQFIFAKILHLVRAIKWCNICLGVTLLDLLAHGVYDSFIYSFFFFLMGRDILESDELEYSPVIETG